MTEPSADIAANRDRILDVIAAAAKAARRDPAAVTLTAVSKKQPDDRIEAALAAGHRVFGENRVQEAEARWAHRRERHHDLHLRLVGPLQTNKAAAAVALFDVIETLDRPKLAKALRAAMDKTGRAPGVLVQVNTGDEPQKSGVPPGDVDDFIAGVRRDHGLAPQGVMCIPPADEEPALHFALLADIAARHGLSEVSMGMSADFETAVRHGATHVRVGSGIFGARIA